MGKENYSYPAGVTYQDIRDEAVYTYFDLYGVADPGEPVEATFTFTVTVAYAGSYYFPAIHAEAMYDNDIRATVPGQMLRTSEQRARRDK